MKNQVKAMTEKKRVIVAGATGMIGRVVSKRLVERDYELLVFSRNPITARETVPGATDYIQWQPENSGSWVAAVDGAYAVVNLAGAPFFTKWTGDYQKTVRESRLFGTRGLINAMREAKVKPEVFIYGSSVGTYGFNGPRDLTLDENSPAGEDQWGQDSLALEQEAEEAETLGVRVVTMRTGVPLAKDAGLLVGQVPQFRNFFGGWIQPGTQWLPWIHIDDEVALIIFALENERVRGPLNGTAPESQTNHDFYRTLGRVLHRPCWLGLPPSLLRRFLGDVAITVTNGRRIVPTKALILGYQFKYPTSEQALRDLLLP